MTNNVFTNSSIKLFCIPICVDLKVDQTLTSIVEVPNQNNIERFFLK